MIRKGDRALAWKARGGPLYGHSKKLATTVSHRFFVSRVLSHQNRTPLALSLRPGRDERLDFRTPFKCYIIYSYKCPFHVTWKVKKLKTLTIQAKIANLLTCMLTFNQNNAAQSSLRLRTQPCANPAASTPAMQITSSSSPVPPLAPSSLAKALRLPETSSTASRLPPCTNQH